MLLVLVFPEYTATTPKGSCEEVVTCTFNILLGIMAMDEFLQIFNSSFNSIAQLLGFKEGPLAAVCYCHSLSICLLHQYEAVTRRHTLRHLDKLKSN